MRALVLSRYGGPEHTALTNMPQPSPRAGELLIRPFQAAGLKPVDFKTRAGALRIIRNHPLPIVMGNELSGIVEDVGSAVTRFAQGDRVFARVDKAVMGAFAEYAVVHENHAARMRGVPGFPLSRGQYRSPDSPRYRRCEMSCNLSAGQRVFIPGGAGGGRYFRPSNRQAPGRARRDDGLAARRGAGQAARRRRGDRLHA